jgi:hypothetical protein
VDDLTELELGILGRASRLDELARLPQRWSDDDPRRTVALFQVSATFDGLSQLEHQIAFLELGLELRSQQGQTRQLSADPDAEVAAARERLKLLMGTEPAESADDRHRLAERVSKRGEHLRAFELYAELVAEMESFEDPVAWFRRSGYDPWSTYRFAAREAVECMRGNGYLFVPRTLLAWHPDWPCVAAIPGASSSPKLAQDARPSLATSPLFDDALRARCRESIEQWTGRAVDALLLDTLRAKPALDAAARAQVIEEIRATLDALGPDFDPTVSPPISRARQALDELGAKLGE